MNYQSVASFFSPQKNPSFTPRGLGLHAGFNCLAWNHWGPPPTTLRNGRSAFFIPNALPHFQPRKKTLEILPFFRPEETHKKKHMQHAYLKENLKNGKHIDLGEGHQHFTEKFLEEIRYEQPSNTTPVLFVVFLFGHSFLAFRNKIIGISLRPKV